MSAQEVEQIVIASAFFAWIGEINKVCQQFKISVLHLQSTPFQTFKTGEVKIPLDRNNAHAKLTSKAFTQHAIALREGVPLVSAQTQPRRTNHDRG